jgi:hypothetical protein
LLGLGALGSGKIGEMKGLPGQSVERGGEDRALAYETPGVRERRGVLFREGEVVVVRDGTELPAVCVVCGENGSGHGVKLVFTWDASFQVTREKSTLALRRVGSVVAHLCGRHRRRWVVGRVVGVGGMILSGMVMGVGIGMAVVSESSDVPRWTGAGIEVLMAGFGGMILFLFVFALRTRMMSCRRIEEGYLYLEGAGEGFVRLLE